MPGCDLCTSSSHAVRSRARLAILAVLCLVAGVVTGGPAAGAAPTATPGTIDAGPTGRSLADGRGAPTIPLVAPANDDCSGAEVIPGAGPFPHLTAVTADITMATATGDPASPSCQPSVQRSIWYTFTPTATGLYTISSCSDAPTGTTVEDTVIGVYTSSTSACGGTYTEVPGGCDDDSCVSGFMQAVVRNIPLNAGTTYFIVVYQFGGAPPPAAGLTAVQLSVSRVNSPSNDNCSGAIPVLSGTTVTGSESLALDDYTLSGTSCFQGSGETTSCTAAGRDLVYSFTAPSAGAYSFKVQTTDTLGSGDWILVATPTCPASPAAIACSPPVLAANRNTQSVQYAGADEIWCRDMTAGETVYLVVDECAASTAGGGFALDIGPCAGESEPNDTPAEAEVYVPGSSCPFEGSIDPSGDVDFLSLGSPAPDSRLFAIADTVQSNSTNVDMRVTTGTDTLEYDDADNNTPWGADAPNISGRKLTGTADYLRISESNPVSITEPYRLYAVLQPPGFDSYQSSATPESGDSTNGTIAGANAAGNMYFAGTLTSSSDLDLYRFCAAAGDVITLGIDGDPMRDQTPVNATVSLFDSSGAQLFLFEDPNSTSSNSSGAGTLTSLTPRSPGEAATWRARYTGTYYAGIFPGFSGTRTGDYLYSIATDCRPGSDLAVDLTATAADAPDPVAAGTNLVYTIGVTNGGSDIALDAAMIDDLPVGTRFVSISGSGSGGTWSCSPPPPGSGGTVTCVNPCFPPGGSYTFTLTVSVDFCLGDGAVLTNMPALSTLTTDTDGSNDTAFVSTTVSDPAGNCDDNDPCTIDTCDALAGCSNVATTDSDNDGVCDAIDCAPADNGAFAFPAEVTAFGVAADTVTLSWASAAPASGTATVHDVLRGALGQLPVGGGPAEVCLAPGLSAAMTADAAMPAPGEGLWYLVRGRNSCGSGTYGYRASGPERVSNACP